MGEGRRTDQTGSDSFARLAAKTSALLAKSRVLQTKVALFCTMTTAYVDDIERKRKAPAIHCSSAGTTSVDELAHVVDGLTLDSAELHERVSKLCEATADRHATKRRA